MKRQCLLVLFLCMVLLLAAPTALAEPQLSFLREERLDSFVVKPLMIGMENSFVQDSINADIEQRVAYEGLLATLRTLTDAQQTGLQVRAEGEILPLEGSPGLLRLRIDASGKIGPGRPGYRVIPLMYDLSDGRAITAEDIFLDVEAASEAITGIVDGQILPELSNYLDPSGFEPLPLQQLLLEENGLSLFYDAAQLNLLSGRPASLNFHYDELASLLKLGEGSLLQRLGVPGLLKPEATHRDRIVALVEEGRLPGIPFKLNDSVGEIRKQYPLLIDPEAFPGGSRYELEDARLRGAVLITQGAADELQGILSHRMLIYGLATGASQRADALSMLGEPQASLPLDAAAAEGYGIKPGRLDSYGFGKQELCLVYDGQDLLSAVWLRPGQQ